MTIMGSLFFSAVVWQPARRAAPIDRDVVQPPWQHLLNLALIGLIVASIISLLVQAGQAGGVAIAAPWQAAMTSVLFSTRYGVLWIARLALTFVLIGLLLRNLTDLQTSRREQWLMFGAAVLLLLSISLGSHAAGEPLPTLPVADDGLHLLAASV